MAFCSFFGGEIYQSHFEPGIYICSKCGYELFSSQSKFLHSSPWPAFTHPIHSDSISKYLERPGAFKPVSHAASVGMAWVMNSSMVAPKRANLVSEYLAVLSHLFIKINLGRTWKNKQADSTLGKLHSEPLGLDGKLPSQRDLKLNETNLLDFSSSSIQIQVTSTWSGHEMLGRVLQVWKAPPQNSPKSSICQNILPQFRGELDLLRLFCLS
ncbi:hypothetical protein Chor_015009 [Crotalus horridus]